MSSHRDENVYDPFKEKKEEYMDFWSLLVLFITFVLFILALFEKGITHDILLETGVFLVSVKVVMSGYSNFKISQKILERIESLEKKLEEKE